MQIKKDNLTGIAVIELISEHLQGMAENSSAESIHALDLNALRKPDITFWSAWQGEELLGCGALKELDDQQGELKSMRTSSLHLRKGVARNILRHIIDVARQRGYRRISLETGSNDAFEPARKLYQRFGFIECAPFSDYRSDPNSVFMTKIL